MIFNTFNQIFTLARSVATFGLPDNYSYSTYSSVNAGSGYHIVTCNYGNVESVLTLCPYNEDLLFRLLLILWAIFFVSFISFRLIATMKFNTGDLRFFVACDMLNRSSANIIFVIVGMGLTVCSFLVILVYVLPQMAFSSNASTTILNGFVFCGLNCYALNGFFTRTYTIKSLSVFPDPIPFRVPDELANEVFPLRKVTCGATLVSHDKLLRLDTDLYTHICMFELYN